MAKEKFYTGYAVVSKSILDDKTYKNGSFGISISDRDLETCKRYCHDDSIVVRTYRDVLARFVKFKWVRKYPEFRRSRKYENPSYIQLWHLRIECGTDYTNGYERIAVYQKEQD